MTRPRPGDQCPDFRLLAHDGTLVTRDSLQGQRFVLYFYPRDDSPGCTTQACQLRDEFASLRALSVSVFGISPDSAQSHAAFRAKHGLPFRLLSDRGHRVADVFGVWIPATSGGLHATTERTTFVVDADGRIEAVLRNVAAHTHREELLEALHANL